MKKALLIALCLLLAFSLIGCAQQANEPAVAPATQDPAPEQPTSEQPSPEQPAPEQPTPEQPTSQENEAFNPDIETDTIPFDQLEARFGPVPEFDDVTIGVILKNNANEFWLQLAEGMERGGAELGAVRVDVQATRTETDTAGQLAIAETMLENDYTVLLLSPLDNTNLDPAVSRAISDGVPIVNVNCEYIFNANSFVGPMQIEIGRMAADYIADKLGGEGTVAILEGVPGTFTNTQRIAGFMENIVNYPGIEIVAQQTANYELEQGLDVATNILTLHPDVDAFYCANDNMALGVVEALRGTGRLGEVIIVGVDGTGGAFDSIRAGEMTATVDQFPELNGFAGVEVAFRLLGGQAIPRVVSTPVAVIDANNMAQYGK